MFIKILRNIAIGAFCLFGISTTAFLLTFFYENEEQRQIVLFLASFGSCVAGFCCLFISFESVKIQQDLTKAITEATKEIQETKKILAKTGITKIARKYTACQNKNRPRVKGKMKARKSL